MIQVNKTISTRVTGVIPPLPNDKLIDISQVSELLNIEESEIKNMVRKDMLPCYHIAKGVMRFSVNEISDFLQNCKRGRSNRRNEMHTLNEEE